MSCQLWCNFYTSDIHVTRRDAICELGSHFLAISVHKMTNLPQDTETDFAIPVEVGVEPDRVVAGGDELDARWVDGVVRRTSEQEEEEAAFVGRIKRPSDQSMDLVGTF